MAEGVRIYSQDTWKQVTHSEGKNLVEKNINNVVRFQQPKVLKENFFLF